MLPARRAYPMPSATCSSTTRRRSTPFAPGWPRSRRSPAAGVSRWRSVIRTMPPWRRWSRGCARSPAAASSWCRSVPRSNTGSINPRRPPPAAEGAPGLSGSTPGYAVDDVAVDGDAVALAERLAIGLPDVVAHLLAKLGAQFLDAGRVHGRIGGNDLGQPHHIHAVAARDGRPLGPLQREQSRVH